MKSLRRLNLPDRQCFVTLVTFERRPILTRDFALLDSAWSENRPLAWVVLPDHLHAIIEVKSETLSANIHRFKITFSRRFRDRYGDGRVWQNRFWDHVIRDQDDWNSHIDYIHYNPVHHGLVDSPLKYPFSSVEQWIKLGLYEERQLRGIEHPGLLFGE